MDPSTHTARLVKALLLNLCHCWWPCSMARLGVTSGVYFPCCWPPPTSHRACFPYPVNTCFVSSRNWPYWEAKTRIKSGRVILQSWFLPALSVEWGWWHQSRMIPKLLWGSGEKTVMKLLFKLKINTINNYFVTFLLTYIHKHTVCSESLAKALLFLFLNLIRQPRTIGYSKKTCGLKEKGKNKALKIILKI